MPISKVISLPEKRQVLLLGLVEHAARTGQIAAHQGLEHGKLHADLGQVFLVFQGRAGGGADHVAEIIERQSRHDRVEVDDANAFLRGVVQHHVVELRVVVRRPLGQNALGLQVDQPRGDRLAAQGEIDFRPGRPARLAASASMACSNAAKRLGVLWKSGIVSCNRGSGQVGQEALELPERLGRLVGLLRRFHGIVGPGILNEDVSPPAFALGIDVEQPPVAGRYKRERRAA